MDIFEAMDLLLASADERGREPLHWQMRQQDWLEIGRQFRANLLKNPAAVGANTYKGIPVHFSKLTENAIVGLVDGEGPNVVHRS